MMLRLKQAGIGPKNHILDNKVSEAMNSITYNKYHMEMEIVPPDCHRHNAAEAAIRNFKVHILSVLAGTAVKFHTSLWDK